MSLQTLSLQTLKEQAYQLPASDRLELATAILQSLQPSSAIESWQFLVVRPHSWRRQLYVKGRKLLASIVWQDMLSNNMMPDEAADNWELSLSAIQEIIRYCETHQDLLKLEAEEERCRLQDPGVSFEPITAAG
jgi:uncharacterized protein (DUF433 family)